MKLCEIITVSTAFGLDIVTDERRFYEINVGRHRPVLNDIR